VFPSDWKIAHVIPLFKNGDKSLPSNYRPISLLSCVSKVLEKIMFKHVFNHLLENKLFLSSVMKIWQDSIIVVQLGNREKIFVQNIGFLSGIICQIKVIEWIMEWR
jgi:hypothetical protein